MLRRHWMLAAVLGLLTGWGSVLRADEPTWESARGWWPEMPATYVPVGWAHHPLRFCVFFDGSIYYEGNAGKALRRPYATRWSQEGIQIYLMPTVTGESPFPMRRGSYLITDTQANRTGCQGWSREHATPVLWTRWKQPIPEMNGITLKQEIFAQTPDSRPTTTGQEPLFAWVRLSVDEVMEWTRVETVSLVLELQSPRTIFDMSRIKNLRAVGGRPTFRHQLEMEERLFNSRKVWLFRYGGGCQMIIFPGDALDVNMNQSEPEHKIYKIMVTLPVKKGAACDLLLPALSAQRGPTYAQIEKGYDGALAESDAFWSQWFAQAARVEVPETPINEAVRANLYLSAVLAEINPDNGELAMIHDPQFAPTLLAVPEMMRLTMLLDGMGLHAEAARYLALFRKYQGQGAPLGIDMGEGTYSGYYSLPEWLPRLNWLANHGAVLHAICRHGLLTGDDQFIEEYQDSIVRACEFIARMRAWDREMGASGVMPPASSQCGETPDQAVWTDGWMYKGLSTAVRLLRRIDHPRAAEFEQEMVDYKAAFVEALDKQAMEMPQWTDAQGRNRILVPMALMGGDETLAFYLDYGPLFLVYAGLMEADSELMAAARDYFHEGPNWKMYDPQGHYLQPPVLQHELSSCTPYLSWNVYHAHQAGDRGRFLEGFYSLLTGAMSQRTYVSSQARGGVSGLNTAMAPAFDLMRLAVIDDAIEPGALHLLRLVPKAWLSTERQSVFEKLPTEYGPVTVKFQLAEAGKTLAVEYAADFHHKPGKVVLHVPPVEDIEQVSINGQVREVSADGIIVIE